MSDNTIDAEEVQHHLEILRRILEAADAEERSSLFVEGFSKFGPRFLVTLHFEPDDPAWREALIPLREEASAVAALWLNGTSYLGSVDEDERRARFGASMVDAGQIGMARLIAKSILSLPETHPLHDRAKARDALLQFVDWVRESGDREGELLAIADLLHSNLVEHDAGVELIARGEELFPLVDAGSTDAISSWRCFRSIRGRHTTERTPMGHGVRRHRLFSTASAPSDPPTRCAHKTC